MHFRLASGCCHEGWTLARASRAITVVFLPVQAGDAPGSKCPYAQEGGLWINLGPLLYHWADAHSYLPGDEASIELPLEDVERVAASLGFTTLQRQLVTAGFNTNARSACTCSPCCLLFVSLDKPGEQG
jgi:hypothetical protein